MAKSDSDNKKKNRKVTNSGLHEPVSPFVTLSGGPPMVMLSARLDAISHTRPLAPEDLLGDRIRSRREEKNLTQEALSILTKYPEIDPEGRGLSRPSIVGYEQGKSLPDARGIRLLAMALDATPSWLILGKYDDPAEPEDPRIALMDALDRYTARRDYEFSGHRVGHAFKPSDLASSETPKKIEGLDSNLRAELEKTASEEALIKKGGAPALYSIDTRTRPGKDSKPTLTVVGVKFVKAVEIFKAA